MSKPTVVYLLIILFTSGCQAMEGTDEAYLTILTEDGKGPSISLTEDRAKQFPAIIRVQQNALHPITHMPLKIRHTEPTVQQLVHLVTKYPEIILSKKQYEESDQKTLTETIEPIIKELSLPTTINMYDLATTLGMDKRETILGITLGKKIANDTRELTQDEKDELTRKLITNSDIKATQDTIQFLLNIPVGYFKHIFIATINDTPIEVPYHLAQLSKFLRDQINNSKEEDNIVINLKDNFNQYTVNLTINLINKIYSESQKDIQLGNEYIRHIINNIDPNKDSLSIKELIQILNFLELLDIQVPSNYIDETNNPLHASNLVTLKINMQRLRLSIEKDLINKINMSKRLLIQPLQKLGTMDPNPQRKSKPIDYVKYVQEHLNPAALKKLINTYPPNSKGHDFIKTYILPQSLLEPARKLYKALAEKAYTYRNYLAGAALAGLGVAAIYYQLYSSQ